jgi:hypothetical protein
LDGHATHGENMATLNFARENGIVLLQLYRHTAHSLQPFDVAFFDPLQVYFIQAQEKYKGHHIRQADIPSLLNESCGSADTVANAQSAFRATEIWPVDPHIFQEHRFAPVAVLIPADTAQLSSSEIHNPEISLGTESYSEDSDDSSKHEDYRPSGKRMNHMINTLQKISPLPKLSADPRPTVSRRSHGRAQKATVLTSSRYK